MGDQRPPFKYLKSTFQVTGVSTIEVLNGDSVSTLDDDLLYYKGLLSFSQNYSVDCNVIAFDLCQKNEVNSLVSRLNCMSSPYISMPLACGTGSLEFSERYFLALPKFTCTLAQFINEGRVSEKRRFKEEFIQVIRNVVYGILAVQEKGFCCRELAGKDVLISLFENTAAAKIWNIQPGNAKQTSGEWIMLGNLIHSVAVEEQLNTVEINDLCQRLIFQGLKGLKVLKHSALLTTRQKFDNILALNLYIKVNSPDRFAAAKKRNPEKQNAINKLLALMRRRDIDWCMQIPLYIAKNKHHKPRTDPAGRFFISWLRYISEHEHIYVPPLEEHEKPNEVRRFGSQPDLEAYVRGSMAEIFLLAQNVAADLELEY